MILRAVELGAGDGPPLVLLHGLFGRAHNFGTVQRRLATTRRVLALDLRNHGASGHDAVMDYPTMAADVAETLAAAGIVSCVLVGHSMGGKAAMALALGQAAGLLAGLVVADIAPVPYPPHFRTYADAMRSLPLAPGLTRLAADAALAPAIPDRGVRAFLLQNLRPGADPAWTCGLREIAAALPTVEGFPPVTTRFAGPTLVVSGGRSDYVRPEHAAVFREAFPASRATVLPGAGHWLHAEDPDGFVAAVDGFAASLT